MTDNKNKHIFFIFSFQSYFQGWFKTPKHFVQNSLLYRKAICRSSILQGKSCYTSLTSRTSVCLSVCLCVRPCFEASDWVSHSDPPPPPLPPLLVNLRASKYDCVAVTADSPRHRGVEFEFRAPLAISFSPNRSSPSRPPSPPGGHHHAASTTANRLLSPNPVTNQFTASEYAEMSGFRNLFAASRHCTPRLRCL